ncbi:unnamed protein product [Larinioides sclopetarius]|uniref:Uncharacterized protein n=1 Tax=Larinioides sclopetarius TaxID=280406 RepID=A0AAV1ZS53_9ARAC
MFLEVARVSTFYQQRSLLTEPVMKHRVPCLLKNFSKILF